MQCEPNLAIFTTANWIAPVSSESKHKLCARQFINETIDRVYTAIAPSALNNQRSNHKSTKRQPTAHFYDSLTETDANRNTDKYNSEIMTESIKEDDSTSISGKNKYKDHKLYLNDIPIPIECKGSSLVSCQKNENHINDKIKRTESNINESDVNVVAKNDIEEFSRNEQTINTVSNRLEKENVDLADLLGTNWPTNAGEAGLILNRAKLGSKLYDNKLETSTPSNCTYETFAKKRNRVSQVPSSSIEVNSSTGKIILMFHYVILNVYTYV